MPNLRGLAGHLLANMKHRISELKFHPLNVAVAKLEGLEVSDDGRVLTSIANGEPFMYRPSEDPEQGDPILEREGISVKKQDSKPEGILPELWIATGGHVGETRLIAGMRAYVYRKVHAEEIELP